MPNYYNTYSGGYVYPSQTPMYNPYPQQPVMYSSSAYGMQGNNYMISVDGEMAARAWQMPQNLAPGTIIPLWDLDGQHVYFKSTDNFGRINPLRKGRVVFDDEPAIEQNLTAGESRTESNFVTREDFEGLRHEIQDMIRTMHQEPAPANQNGSQNQSGNNRNQNNQNNQNWKKNG